MKKTIAFLGVIIATLFFSGCASFTSNFVNLAYGRSGVFVTNNYSNYTIRLWTNNGMEGFEVKTGQTAQVITSGLMQGDTMLLTAKFYDSSGNYRGYDSQGFRVWYDNGRPFVRTWDPYLNPSYK